MVTREDTLDRIMAYIKKFPDLDPEMTRAGLTLFHLHREVEILIETYASKRYGMSERQMETLEALFHKQDISLTPAQLAEEVHLTRSAMTSNLDSLARKGYLSRTAHPDDRRMILINITQKGIKLCGEMLPERYREMAKIMRSQSVKERKILLGVFNNIKKSITEMLTELGS